MGFLSEARTVYLGWSATPVSEQVGDLIDRQCHVVFARHCKDGENLDQEALAALRPDYLFSFGPVIVRGSLLDAVARAAINFHTAPPRWPGRGSVSFALFHEDNSFGVTAHLMTEAVDQGPILRVHRFAIEPGDSVSTLDRRAKDAILPLAAATLDDLEASGGAATPLDERWERRSMTRRDLERLMRVEAEDDDDVVRRKIRAFAHPEKPGPFIERGGYRFWYSAAGPGSA